MIAHFLPCRALLFFVSAAAALGATADAQLQQKFDLANEKAAAGFHVEAIELYNQILTERPDSDNTLIQRATARVELGQASAAGADLAQALRLNPKNAAAFRVRAEIKLQAGEVDGALQDLDKAVELAPNVAINHALRGQARFLLKRFDAALGDVERALELAPSLNNALALRGDILQAMGNLSLGFADYSRLIEVEPENPERLLHRAWRRFKTRDFESAIADVNRAIALPAGRGSPDGGRLKGYSQFARGDDVSAIATLAEAARSPSADENIYALLIRQLAMRRIRVSDDGLLAAAAEIAADKSWPKTLAKFLLGKIDEEGLEALATQTEKPSERSVRMCEMHFYVGMVRLISGDKSTARLRLRSAVATNESALVEYTLTQAFLAALETAQSPAAAVRKLVDPQLLRRGENGDSEAQWLIAETYRRQSAQLQDAGKMAKAWWIRAVASGSDAAKAALAVALIEGTNGFAKDELRGVRMLEAAADAAHPEAMWQLGERYVFGPQHFRRDDRAIHYLKGALEKGETRAQPTYAYLLFRGRGVAADPQEAVRLLNAAEKRGDMSARRALLALWKDGEIQLKVSEQLERILEYGAEAKDPIAMRALGVRRYHGDGRRKDEEGGLMLLHSASDKGDFEAAGTLSEIYTARLAAQKQKSGSQAKDYENALDDLRWAWFEVGRNGTREHKVQAARMITDFADPATPVMKNRLIPKVASEVAAAVALLRIYRTEGGKDSLALAWLDKMERHLGARSPSLAEVQDFEDHVRETVRQRNVRLREL